MTRVLCLHGLGGAGATMWPVVAACSDAGFAALAPTLPGHGTNPADLTGVTWDEWMTAARDWEADVVVGQSMGADLALQLAAEGRCRAVVAINPVAPDPDAVDGLQWRQSRGQEWVDLEPSTIGEIAYERLPVTALIAMHSGIAAIDFAAVRQPVLVITSVNDDVVDPASSDTIAASVDSDVQRLKLQRSGHVATLDSERLLVQKAVTTFVRAQTVSGSTGSHPTRGR
jgi:carboxylesterase